MICQKCNLEMVQEEKNHWVCTVCFSGAEPDRVIDQGVWTLQVFYRAKGTRSEGPHGVLCKDSSPIPDPLPGTILETEMGLMKYYKNPKESHLPFNITGWNYADSSKILPSWKTGDLG